MAGAWVHAWAVPAPTSTVWWKNPFSVSPTPGPQTLSPGRPLLYGTSAMAALTLVGLLAARRGLGIVVAGEIRLPIPILSSTSDNLRTSLPNLPV